MNAKRTVLHDTHVSLGAKMAPFAGYEMPIQYRGGIIAEHKATRERATVFDTCHMGEFRIEGERAEQDLERILSCRVSTLEVGRCRYGFICNEEGGVIDDQITYRMGEDEFFMVVNAGTQEGDYEWVASHLSAGTRSENIGEQTAKLDLQGPGSVKVMARLMEEEIKGMKYYRWRRNRFGGKEVLTSRTGYTGEIGFEIYCEPEVGVRFFNACLEEGVEPAGLGARDTLRLEMGFPLYGHELSAGRNAAESGLLRSIATDKEFIGSEVVLDESRRESRLVGLMLQGRRAARAGDRLTDLEGAEVGVVTSGSFAPSLGKSIAMGYVRVGSSEPSTGVKIKTERYELGAVVTGMPFYGEATGRKKMSRFL
jgi:aminomethyltransferase